MLDINLIRKNPELIRQEIKKRQMRLDVDELLKLDKKRRDLLVKIEKLRAKQNKLSDQIARLSGREKQKAILEGKALAKRLDEQEPRLRLTEKKFHNLMSQLPNISHETVPEGRDGSGNVVVKTWGKLPKFSFKPKDHIILGKDLDLIDIEKAAKVSGSRFYYLKNEAVLLEWALINYVFDLLNKKGYIPILPPQLVNYNTMYGSGFLPAEEFEIYRVNPEEDNLYIIGTAEASICAYHQGEIFNEKELPKKYVGFSTNQRREAGAYGKKTWGIFRVHQFDKVEMFKFTREDNSWKELDDMVQTAEEIVQGLNLPYQIRNVCTGDLCRKCAKTLDIEAWMAVKGSGGGYGEIGSGSNCTDYQARRLNIKYKDMQGKKHFVHTLNCTACAIGRTLIAILENYQQKDGSVLIPRVLQKYCGFERIRKK